MTEPGRRLEAVIFDWGGTLTPWHAIDLAEQWLAYARRYEADVDRAEALALALEAAEEDTWRRARAQHVSGTLDDVFRRCGVEPSGPRHERALAAYEEFWTPHTLLDPYAAATIDGLHERGLAVGVLSNTMWTRAQHEAVFARDGILDRIDGAVYSSEIPWAKPHPEAFRAAMQAVGATDPTRCVFVGDRPFEDIHGPQQIGMRAVLVPHSAIPDYQRGPTQGQPDAVVDRLTDLLAVVDRWLATP